MYQAQQQNAFLAQNVMQNNQVLAGFGQPKGGAAKGKEVKKEEKKGIIQWMKDHKAETVIMTGVTAAIVHKHGEKKEWWKPPAQK